MYAQLMIKTKRTKGMFKPFFLFTTARKLQWFDEVREWVNGRTVGNGKSLRTVFTHDRQCESKPVS